jgi:hypothetical protein
VKVPAKIDDFERSDGRTSLDTLRTNDADRGRDRSTQVTTLIDRETGGHALNVAAKMSYKDDGQAGVILPLTRGSIRPAEITAYRGVRFEIRGSLGNYGLFFNGLNGRWGSSIKTSNVWQTIEVPFTSLKSEGRRSTASISWSGNDLVSIEFTGGAKANAPIWFQVDNVEFY